MVQDLLFTLNPLFEKLLDQEDVEAFDQILEILKKLVLKCADNQIGISFWNYLEILITDSNELKDLKGTPMGKLVCNPEYYYYENQNALSDLIRAFLIKGSL